jgi:aminoglycoside phosphotransferase (APT) family kinase protein
MTLASKPAAEWPIDAALVGRLLREQHPDLATLPIEAADTGWDNAMFRLGTELAVRMPRRSIAIALIEHEQRWLPEIAARVPLPVPRPLRIGVPDDSYRAPWSVVPWLTGRPASESPLLMDEAGTLARFLNALHTPAPAIAPRNPVRGIPLGERSHVVTPRLERLRQVSTLIDSDITRIWEQALAAPTNAVDHWLHGDLHPANVLAENGRITAIIDWGDVCAGDRATDLASLWMLLPDPAARERAMAACDGVDEATWQRARGWAVSFGTVLLEAGLQDNSTYAVTGANTLRNLVNGP